MATALEWKAQGWPDGFAWSEEAEAVLHLIDNAFAGVDQPQNFANADHCSECFEYDMALKARPRMEMRRADLGQSCSDPVTFANPQGIAYLMPVLARYAMAPDFWPDLDLYAGQIVYRLTGDGPNNQLVQFCSPVQRKAIAAMIGWTIENKADVLTRACVADEWLAAADIWPD